MFGRTGRAGLPLLCAAEERVGERRCVTENCDRPTSRPSLSSSLPARSSWGESVRSSRFTGWEISQASVPILPVIRPNWYESPSCHAIALVWSKYSKVLMFSGVLAGQGDGFWVVPPATKSGGECAAAKAIPRRLQMGSPAERSRQRGGRWAALVRLGLAVVLQAG
jgi:hypothetical protein